MPEEKGETKRARHKESEKWSKEGITQAHKGRKALLKTKRSKKLQYFHIGEEK